MVKAVDEKGGAERVGVGFLVVSRIGTMIPRVVSSCRALAGRNRPGTGTQDSSLFAAIDAEVEPLFVLKTLWNMGFYQVAKEGQEPRPQS